MIVTGALAQAIDKASKKYYSVGVGDWVMQHLTQSFNSYELNKLQDAYDFKVYCDQRFNIDNNTECGALVHKAKFIGNTRSNWLKVSIKDMATKAAKANLLR